MNKKKVFFRFFAKIYYLDQKEKNSVSINDFRNWNHNKKYDNFFEKINEFDLIKNSQPYAKSDHQNKRLYELFKYAVSSKVVFDATIHKIFENLTFGWININEGFFFQSFLIVLHICCNF